MASHDSINSSMHEEDDYDDQHHHYNMSRLSMCTENTKYHSTYADNDDEPMINMSLLSVQEESDGIADGEFSDEKEGREVSGFSDDSDKESRWYSLPQTPDGITPPGSSRKFKEINEYGSESESTGQDGLARRNASRRILKERWLEKFWEMRKCKAMDEEIESKGTNDNKNTNQSEDGDSRRGSGRRNLCMDTEEVKGCRDLGFELQHEWMVEIPSRISCSPIDTDSGGNSPNANRRISSPGDDPRDVKARLRVWAQAVALASTCHING